MSKSTNSLLAFLMGAVTGAALGVLYAPEKGEHTRERLAFQLNKYRDQLKTLIEELVDGNDMPESNAKSESKKVVSDARKKAERLLSDVEDLMGQIKSKA
jgi:gas vesicle protein